MRERESACVCACVYASVCVCMCVCTCVNVFMRVCTACVCMCICVYESVHSHNGSSYVWLNLDSFLSSRLRMVFIYKNYSAIVPVKITQITAGLCVKDARLLSVNVIDPEP